MSQWLFLELSTEHRGQAPTSRYTANDKASRRIRAQQCTGCIVGNPFHAVPGVVLAHWELVLWRMAVIDADHGRTEQFYKRATYVRQLIVVSANETLKLV
jgi:hypothetical protein